MIITPTKIPDVNITKIEEEKVILTEKIIKNIQPLLDEYTSEKESSLSRLQNELSLKKKKVNDVKHEIEKLILDYGKKKKIEKLVIRLDKLISSGLTIQPSMSNDIIILLKTIHNMSEDKIDYHLTETMKGISKRFSKR